jgi:hypothetical protein
MSRILGVTCSGPDAYWSVLDGDDSRTAAVILMEPQKVSPVQAGDDGDALARSLGQWESAIRTVKPDVVTLLLPEGGEMTKRPHATWAPRISAETLCQLAAGRLGIPVEVLQRATVRSRLDVTGKLELTVKQLEATGKHWKERGLAFLAAKAAFVHAEEHGWPTHRAAYAEEAS